MATAIGLLCSHWVSQPAAAAGLAVAISIWLMARFNCIHPPGGALALLIVLNGPYTSASLLQTVELVALNVAALLVATLVINRWVLRRRYPHSVSPIPPEHQTQDLPPMQRMGLVHADLASAVQALNTFVDVQEDELVEIYNLAMDHAFGRHVSLTCVDVMSRDVVTAHFDTDLGIAGVNCASTK